MNDMTTCKGVSRSKISFSAAVISSFPHTGDGIHLCQQVGQYYGRYSFQHNRHAQRNTEIVPSLHRKRFLLVGFPIQRHLVFRGRRSRFNGDPKHEFIAIGDAAYHATGMIGFGFAFCIFNGIIVLYAKHFGGRKTATPDGIGP